MKVWSGLVDEDLTLSKNYANDRCGFGRKITPTCSEGLRKRS
jgi:hypothetical protein